MNTTMMTKVELNDEMLAQVSGGNSVDDYYNSEEFKRALEEINRKLNEMTPNFVELVLKNGRTN